jgi:F0F1-type ATP synthase membrane subunit b/b'
MQADGEAKACVAHGDKEAARIIASARTHAEEEKQRVLSEAEARSLAMKNDADARAKETLERARKESEREVARLAVLAAEKILKEKI